MARRGPGAPAPLAGVGAGPSAGREALGLDVQRLDEEQLQEEVRVHEIVECCHVPSW
ncbi:hypothetical protein [Streptosporangium saharense]|uniref:hypothetical protein n=1 Tax=Streptosporangium saharense TaxID=1706840 RepID=UPI0034269372